MPSVFKTLTNQEHSQTPANPMHLKLDLAQHCPHSQVSCSLSPGRGQRGMVSPASSNHPAQPWCLHHEGEVNANVTRWCHTLVSPAPCCLSSRDTTNKNYYKTGFLPASAALMSQEVVSNLGIGELLTEPNYFLTVFLTPLENKTPT